MSFQFLNKLKFVKQYLGLLGDPTNLEHVIGLNMSMVELATEEQKETVMREIRTQPLAVKAIRERPRLTGVSIQELSRLPAHTLGGAYARFVIERNLRPEDLPVIDPRNEGDEFTYARAHLFECHDLWHVVTGFDTDIAGELGLQGFYLAQFPAALALVLFSNAFLSQTKQPIENGRATLEAISAGYAMGKAAHDVIGRDWAKEWGRDLTALQADLGIRPWDRPSLPFEKRVAEGAVEPVAL